MSTRLTCAWISCASFLLLGAATRLAAEPFDEDKPPGVNVSRPVSREVTDFEEFTGRCRAASFVEIRARVSGYLEKVSFKDGAEVKRGDLLCEIDPRLLHAELQKAEAMVALKEAQLKLAEANHARAKALQDKAGISAEELDRITCSSAEAESEIRVARAARDVARLNLEFTKVSAPISGRISQRFVDPGGLVRADETILATIVSQDPTQVYFEIDEKTALGLLRAMKEGKLKSTDGTGWMILAGLADEKGFPRKGMVDFMDNNVDPEKGTLRIRAVLPNNDGLMIPGLFVRIRVPIGAPYKALLVSDDVIGKDDGKPFLLVVNGKNMVEQRFIEPGTSHDGLRAIKEGLKPDDSVVLDGLGRFKPGRIVSPSLVPMPGAPVKPK
jgi:RND family efflux transporter MFP subunit